MGDPTWLVAPAPDPAGPGLGYVDQKIRARGRGHMHLLRRSETLDAGLDLGFERRIGAQALEHLGVLVGDHEQTCATAENGRHLGRVQHAFNSQIHNEAAGAKRVYDGVEPAYRQRSAGGADGDGLALLWRWQYHVIRSRAEA